MGRGKGEMLRRMPVLRQDDIFKTRRDAMNDGDNRVAVANGQRAAGTEVILYIDDEEEVLGRYAHRGGTVLTVPFVHEDAAHARGAARDSDDSCACDHSGWAVAER